jgi:hypothetical protein
VQIEQIVVDFLAVQTRVLVTAQGIDSAACAVDARLLHGLAEGEVRKAAMHAEFHDAAGLHDVHEPEGKRSMSNPGGRHIVLRKPE